MALLLDSARANDWYAPQTTRTGAKAHPFEQHRTETAKDRLALRAEDWYLDCAIPLRNRPVLLLDDVFVSGATTFSYAHAHREAGAAEVRVVTLIRHLSTRSVDYGDALRITRRTVAWDCDPAFSSVGEPARMTP
jgi:hypothetical protein